MKKTRTWEEPVLKRWVAYNDQCVQLLQLSVRAIEGLPHEIALLEAVHNLQSAEAEYAGEEQPSREDIDRTKELAKFAEEERVNGFPLLHAHALTDLWSILEATVEDLLVANLVNEPEILAHEAFSKISIPLSEFRTLDEEERMRLVLSEFSRNRGAERRKGVERFEILLEPFGLAGPVEKELKKTIWEIQNVRNVLVHRAGIADRKFVQACPWLNLSVGDRVTVTRETFDRYYRALSEYGTLLVFRFGSKYGIDVRGAMESKRAATAKAEDKGALPAGEN